MVETLQRRFGIPGVVTIDRGRGGLPVVRVNGPASGEVCVYGGHVLSWVPAGAGEVLFVSRQARYAPGRAIRGGIPVCFPWFGAHQERGELPAHGFVRTRPWSLDAIDRTEDGVAVTMSIASDAETRRDWPHEFLLVNRVTFARTLQVELTVRNTGGAPFTFEEALHTYYRVADVSQVTVRGLDGTTYLDSLDHLHARPQPAGIDFRGEVDRIYLETGGRDLVIDDPSWRRRVHVTAAHSGTTVVWNPWVRKAQALADLGDDEWREFVCVETCNVRPAACALRPREQHVLRLAVDVRGANPVVREGDR